MPARKIIAKSNSLVLLIALLAVAFDAPAETTQLTDSPLSSASSVQISPNIQFVLDDSASMNDSYLPDWAGVANLPLAKTKNASFNGIAYNPAVTYTPPKYFKADGTADSTTYPSQTGMSIAEGADASAKPNWKKVKNDGYGVQSTTTSDLTKNAYYFTTVAGEYCTNSSLKTCSTTSAANATYTVAAKLRWCTTAAEAAAAIPTAGACQATQIEPNPPPPATALNTPFTFPRMPSPRVSTIAISGSSSTSISSIKVDDKEILRNEIGETTLPATLANEMAIRINACTYGLTGNCQVVGYSAEATGSAVTISAPDNTGSTPVITQIGSMTVSPGAFAHPATNLAPGENLLTVITATTTYPKSANRSDCAADPCAYAEEMTNYANWWAYYSTRMQAMKTAASQSFEPISGSKRIGYSTINNNTKYDFQNIAAFDGAQKKAWYDKLFAAVPKNNTPLRVALANIGRLYAGGLNGATFNGSAVVDPVQYYCQQNVVILSTDGYWNEGKGYQLDGTTDVGDQDGTGLETRPQLDGGGPQDLQSTLQNRKVMTPTNATWLQTKYEYMQHKTSSLLTQTFNQAQSRTQGVEFRDAIIESSTSQLQSRTKLVQTATHIIDSQLSTLQTRSGPLQQQTKGLESKTFTKQMEQTSHLQRNIGQRQSMTYQLQQRLTQVQKRTSSNGGTSWTDWGDVASCSPVTSGIERTQCQTLAVGDWNSAASCTVISGETTVANPGSDGEVTTYNTKSECRYDTPSWVNVATCTGPATAVLPADYSVEHPLACQTISWGGWADAGSCAVSVDSAVDCRYGDWSVAAANPSCSALAQASDFSVAIARKCSLAWTDDWADAGVTCTATATTLCQYKADWSSPTDVSICTAAAASAGPTYVQQVACPIAYGAWEPATGSCTVDTTGHWRKECKYSDWTSNGADASCPGSELAQSTGPTYTVQTAKHCLDYWTDYVTTGTCDAIDNVTTCHVEWSPWSDASSTCTPVAETATTGTECRYKDWSSWSTVSSCVAAPRTSDPPYTQVVAKQCQPIAFPTAWTTTAAACTPSATRQCRYAADWSAWSNVASCTAVAAVDPANATVPAGGARQCQTGWTDWYAAGTSCTTSTERLCAYAAWSTAWTYTASECTETPQSGGPTYVPAETCRTAVLIDWTPKPTASDATDPPVLTSGISCTGGKFGGLIISCQYVVPNASLPIPVVSCAESTAADGVVTTCSPLSTGPTEVAKCTESAPVKGNNYVKTTCTVDAKGQTPDTLADVAEYYWRTDLRDPAQTPNHCTGGPIVSGTTTATTYVCTNDDNYPKQNMYTYTLGLGASGLMQYQSDYPTATSGDYYSVAHETTADPSAGVCSWQNDGVCNWPKPESNKQSNIDDLWHAAVNGRGRYFSASNPAALAAGISDALTGIDIKAGSLSAVTVTSANLAAGDNSVFEISFTAKEWSGEMVKRSIDADGVMSTDILWSAQTRLDAQVSSGTHTARRIYTHNPGAGSATTAADDNLKFFVWDNLSPTQQNAFLKPAIDALSQFCTAGTTCLASTTQDNTAHSVASGINLLNFVRGDRSHEGPLADTGAYYRQRAYLLGDIVGSEAVYVKGSPWSYADYGYAGFKTANTSTSPRKAMVYVGANDGMLHAFYANDEVAVTLPAKCVVGGATRCGGEEAWAYVPALLIPKLYALADKSYPTKHQFFVDGAPVMGDICTSNCSASTDPAVWKTILVGGFNHGGRGYYALDISDPEAPKALWEFSDDNMGYSYGNPVISKLKDGTWVVMVTSGYNNVVPGDGKGRLFILDANTGELIRSIATDTGDTTTPAGLSRIAAWADYPDSNNTARRVYGGDLLGNLWRFDINGDIPEATATPVYDAQRLATLKDGSGNGQPITIKPELGKIKTYPVVFVATGRLLGSDDLATTQTQSIYAIKDRLTVTDPLADPPTVGDYGNPRSLSSFVKQTMTSGSCSTEMAATGYCTAGEAIVQISTSNAVDFNTNDGWYADFPVAGERVNTDLRLVDRTLTFNTNTPKLGACVPVAVSFAYFLDYRTGAAVEGTSGMAGRKIADSLASTPSLVRLADGTISELIRTDTPGTTKLKVPIASDAQNVRRVSWRELVTE